jgi:hypothetical protein
VNQTLPMMQWRVNEQFVEYGECETFQHFIKANNPVIQTEYRASEVKFTHNQLCGIGDAILTGFRTLFKNMGLDYTVMECSNA